MSEKKSFPWVRASRVITVILGLILAAGVVSKLTDWESTRDAMTVYFVMSWLPPALPAVGSLIFETFTALMLLGSRTWRRWGLLTAGAFLTFTGILLAVETLTGGSGDCGCIPFLPRDIGWLAAGQNISAALFLFSLWSLVAEEGKDTHDPTIPVTAGDS